MFIDDATRYIVAARFYDNQKVDIIEDTLRMAVMRYGKPDAIYVDNGKQYRSEWLAKACTRLEIRLLHARPYHPEGKGKVEAFNRRIDSFLSEPLPQRSAVRQRRVQRKSPKRTLTFTPLTANRLYHEFQHPRSCISDASSAQ